MTWTSWTYTTQSGENEAKITHHQDYHRKWGCETIFGTQLWCFSWKTHLWPLPQTSAAWPSIETTWQSGVGTMMGTRNQTFQWGTHLTWVILIIDVFWRFLMFYSFSPLLNVVILGVHDHFLCKVWVLQKTMIFLVGWRNTPFEPQQHGLGRPVSFADKCRP